MAYKGIIIEYLLVIIFPFDEKLDNYAPKRNYTAQLPLDIYVCVFKAMSFFIVKIGNIHGDSINFCY